MDFWIQKSTYLYKEKKAKNRKNETDKNCYNNIRKTKNSSIQNVNDEKQTRKESRPKFRGEIIRSHAKKHQRKNWLQASSLKIKEVIKKNKNQTRIGNRDSTVDIWGKKSMK